MIYHPELYYFYDTKNFPLKKALLVTAEAVSQFCYDYSASLIAPKKGVKEIVREGILPKEKTERKRLVKEILDWIEENSECLDLFALFLYAKERNTKVDECEKFDHHDDTCCWALNLTADEFEELRKAWKENGLPSDLFYDRDQEAQKGFFSYSPKRWEVKNGKK